MSTTTLQDLNDILAQVEIAIPKVRAHPAEAETNLANIKKTALSRIEILETPPAPVPTLTLSNIKASLFGSTVTVTVHATSDIVNVTLEENGAKVSADEIPVNGVATFTVSALSAGSHTLSAQGWTNPAGKGGASTPVVTVAVTIPTPAPTGPVGIPGNWNSTPKFFEDFDTGSLPASWWVEQGYNRNGVTVESSNLSFDDSCAILQLSDAQHGVELLTHDLIIAVGDYFEFKAKCLAWGNWMACWACGVTWPQDGESDTLESGNGGHPTYNYHWGLDGKNNQYDSRTYPVADNEFHRWGTLRGATSLQMYLDGEPFGDPIPTDDTGAPWYAILTMGLYGGATGVFGPAGAMWVDSVTVWSPAA